MDHRLAVLIISDSPPVMMPRFFGPRWDVPGIGERQKILQDFFMLVILEILQAQHPAHSKTNLNEG
jgi:hypothetical protein